VQPQPVTDVVEPNGMGELGVDQADQMTPWAERPRFLVHAGLPRQPWHHVAGNEIANLPQYGKLAPAWNGWFFHPCRVTGQTTFPSLFPFFLADFPHSYGSVNFNMSTCLRPATPVDAAHIAEILILARSTFMAYAPSAHTDDEVRLWVQTHLVFSGGVTVAELNGEVVGLMAVSRDPDCRWIDQMYIHPSHVGLGIGSELLAHALATLPPPIRLYTFQANAGARRFYVRHGFVAIKFTDGAENEEHCPDVLYEYLASKQAPGTL